MIDLQPTMSIQHDAEAERGMREHDMIEALNAYCYAERSRVRMLAMLRETLIPHDVIVLDCSGFKWGRQ